MTITAGSFLLVYALLLPWIVRGLVVARLEQAGVAVRHLDVRAVGWNRLDVADADLALAAGVQVESVRVDFDPRRLAAAGASRIRVSGATITLDLEHPETMRWPSGQGGIPPLGRLELAPCRIVVRQGGTVVPLDLEGEVIQDGARSYRLRLALAQDGRKATLKGGVRLAGSGLVESLALDVRLAAPSRGGQPAFELHAAARREGNRLIVEPSGGATGDARNRWLGTLDGLAGLLFEPSPGGPPPAARMLRATLTATNLYAAFGPGAVRAARLHAEAGVDLAVPAVPPPWTLRVGLRDVEWRSGQRVGVPSVEVTARGVEAGDCGSFQVPAWTLGEESFGGVSGVVSRVDRGFEGRVAGPLLGGAALVARAQSAAAGWRLACSLPDLGLDECPPLRGALYRMGGWRAQGRVSLEAAAAWPPAPALPAVTLRFAEAGLRREGLELSGIDGTVHVEGPAPLHTPPRQRLNVRRLAAGRFELTDGEILFRLENDRSLTVDRMGWRWCGGTLACEAFHYGPTNDIFTAVAFAENVEVAQILKLVLEDRGTGTGRLYGRIPLLIRLKPRPGLAFGAGYLYAAPGGGTFSLVSREMIADVLKSGFGKAHGKLSIEDDIARTLQDFAYTELAIDIAPSSTSRPHGSLEINGKGRRKNGLPLRLTLNFTQDEI